MAGARSPRCCARAARWPHDASRIGSRIAFDGSTLIWVSLRLGPFSRSGPELCCDITRAPEGAPQHFPHQAGHDPLDSGEGRVEFLRRNLADVEAVVKDPFLVEAYWSWDQELTEQRKREDFKAVTESIYRRSLDKCLHIVFVWRLRTLRNLLMHGASTNRYSMRRETEEGRRSLTAAVHLLERGVGCFLVVMEDADQRRWPPTDGPRAGSPLHGGLANLLSR
jgi:hypothetical protein